jgi:manganese oxidase
MRHRFCALFLMLAAVLNFRDVLAAESNSDQGLTCVHTVKARVAAIEQQYVYNRFGAFNPAGMMFALLKDVVVSKEEGSNQIAGEDGSPAILHVTGDWQSDVILAGHVRLRDKLRPRPLVLRVNEGDCLDVTFINLLDPFKDSDGMDTELIAEPESGSPALVESDEPATRYASMHVNGLNYAPPGNGTAGVMSDGANAGNNPSSLAAPGQTRHYRWYGKKEGAYLLFSMAAPGGGEGDGGQLGLGLFGSINVEPRNSKWYRSQVTRQQLSKSTYKSNPNGTPQIKYDPDYATGVSTELDATGTQQPVLAMLNADSEIVHSDLNAIIAFEKNMSPGGKGEECSAIKGYGSSCGQPFREFTTIFHDELTAVQAFADLEDEDKPISGLKDGMGINYGAAGLGAMVLANRGNSGPASDCKECKLEEFFLSSWVMGDPALNVQKDSSGKAFRALYPDDPSNVHHSYLGDPVRFRNMHAGPKETHVFHLHAHQWVQDWEDPKSHYLDSQTVSPGSSFTYEIHYSGSGNRNLTPGDSIFHCHLYPHFAQGMWELWRTHDVFENGGPDRNLPDHEILGGTPTPAVVPLPETPLPPMPTPIFKGYPFYIAGVPGHRPPQPPMDIDPDSYAGGLGNDTLRRHVITYGERLTNKPAIEDHYLNPLSLGFDPAHFSSAIASRVVSQNPDPELLRLASKLTQAKIKLLPEDGTPEEKTAMDFHAGKFPNAVSLFTDFGFPSMGYPTCTSWGKCTDPLTNKPLLFKVNGLAPKPGAPFADPCPPKYFLGPKGQEADATYMHQLPNPREYKAAYIQFDMTVNKEGWHDPQARIITLEQDVKDTLDYKRPAEPFFFRANSGECVIFKATNLVPSNLNVDDFQVFSPTDEIGQHIHLVKFDVTSSDGSANGWNYEDATLAAEEIRERINANNVYQRRIGGSQYLVPKTHRLFLPGGALAGDARGVCPPAPADVTDSDYVEELAKHPWCGAQTTIQRWWADPMLDAKLNDGATSINDRTIRTVFTHDHLGPSSHQHHGLYAALIIEPPGSTWEKLDGQPMGGVNSDGGQIVMRDDGGPTSYAANIVDLKSPTDREKNKREYALAFADFSILYTKEIKDSSDPVAPGNRPVNPPNRVDHDLPQVTVHSSMPQPEAISAGDPGTQLLNYRNDPVALRISKRQTDKSIPGQYTQRMPPDADPDCKTEVTTTNEGTTQCAAGDAACIQHYCDSGDLANAFSSRTHQWQDKAGSKSPKFMASAEPAGIRRPGDPATPLLGAYEGDRVQLRLVQGAQEENHVFALQGMKWLAEPDSPDSGYKSGQHLGISEHFEFDADAFEKKAQVTDHMYYSSASDNLWDGQWGLLRVLPSDSSYQGADLPGLKRLPSNPKSEKYIGSGNVCGSAPKHFFEIVAVEAKSALKDGALVYNKRAGINDPNAILFVKYVEKRDYGTGDVRNIAFNSTPEQAIAKLKSGEKQPEPLIMRVAAGECVEVSLISKLPQARQMMDGPGFPSSWSYNLMPPTLEGFNFNQIQESHRVGLTPQLLGSNYVDSAGSNVGVNGDSTVPSYDDVENGGDTRKVAIYQWYAGDVASKTPIEFGAVGLIDMGDAIKHGSHGAVGALIVEPKDASWKTDCDILQDTPNCLDAAATVTYSSYSSNADGVPLTSDRKRVLDQNGRPISGRTAETINASTFREFVVVLQNDVSAFHQEAPLPNLRNGDDSEDSGQKAFNYRMEPLWARLNADPEADPGSMADFDYRNVLSSLAVCKDGSKRATVSLACADGSIPEKGYSDPETPLFTAEAGEAVRFRVVEPSGHPRNHGFSVFGHDWPNVPSEVDYAIDSSGVPSGEAVHSGRLSDKVVKQVFGSLPSNADRYSGNRSGTLNGVGPARHANLMIDRAGGVFRVTGDYLYRTHEGFTSTGGMWGLMRVIPTSQCLNSTAVTPHRVAATATGAGQHVCK